MDPLVAGGEAFGAALTVGGHAFDRVPVGAADGAGVKGGRRSMVGLRRSETQPEVRAAAGGRLDRHRPAMLLGHVLHDR